MSSLLQQIESTEARYRARSEERGRRQDHLERLREGAGGDWREVDEPQRVLRRLMSLGQQEAVAAAIVPAPVERVREPFEAGAEAAPPAPPSLLERILAVNDLLGIRYLLRGALVSRTVGRVVIRSGGRVRGFGTGFMVSPRLLMTNNHVLSSAGSASGSAVQFNFFEPVPGRPTSAIEFALRPDELFLTHPVLDYSLVAVAPRAGSTELATRGWIPLIEASGKAVVGERVNIIQHPGGEPQQVAVHQNTIIDVVDDFLHYSTDTERGSSGSPVLNDQWEVAALHHSGVPARRNGRILLDDGTFWDGSDRDRERIQWLANEGVRISRIVADAKQKAAGRPALVRLVDQAFEPCDYDLENLQLLSALEAARSRPERALAPGGPRFDDAGTATWVLPLTVQVSLPGAVSMGSGGVGDGGGAAGAAAAEPSPGSAAVVAPSTPAGGAAIDEDALRSALASLREHEDEPYYDEAADAEARAAYYPEGLAELPAEELFRTLGRLLGETHTTRPGYRTARLDHLYPWVDLRADRRLRSIYSGEGFDPEEVIRLDLEIAAEREVILRERMAAESFADPEAVEALLDALEAEMPFNCEHVVPQSWFAKAQPMKADLHHLFTCETRCNSFRGNSPFFDFPEDLDEAFQDACGRSEDDRSKFEPLAGKGPAARATLYFLLRYPGLIGDEMRELQAERLAVLLAWHAEFPVDEYERHRNAAIFAVQGNRNPLIDLPELAEAIDFDLGFGVLA
jgi:endonuclease I/V8-like Glu-specific endopeptidase